MPKKADSGTLTITAKGQVTFRREVLEHLGVKPGDKIKYQKMPDGRLTLEVRGEGKPISRLFGALKREGDPVLSIEEMNEIISDGWAGKR